MANGTFMHVYISPKEGITREQVEQKMNLGIDWYRYTNNLYIVYTTADIGKWQSRLQELVEPNGFMFICGFDMGSYNGWMQEDFWNWIKKAR
jgi:hypothetical protein